MCGIYFFSTSAQIALKLKYYKIATIIIKHFRLLLQVIGICVFDYYNRLFCCGCSLMCDERGIVEKFIALTEYR